MRPVLGLLTALPVQWDPDEVPGAWGWTPAVGLLLGLGWLLFHQAVARLAGPFVAGAGVLAIHLALTGARPLRGIGAVATTLVRLPDDARRRALPDEEGAGQAAVALLLLAMITFLIRMDVAPALLLTVPLAGRAAQVVLLGEGDVEVGVPAPSARQRAVVLVGSVVAMVLAPLLALLVRPIRFGGPVEGIGYVVLGAVALAVAVGVGWLARTWLRARFGPLDADGWHAVGGIADLAALAVVASRLG